MHDAVGRSVPFPYFLFSGQRCTDENEKGTIMPTHTHLLGRHTKTRDVRAQVMLVFGMRRWPLFRSGGDGEP